MVIVLPRPVGVCLRGQLSSNVRHHTRNMSARRFFATVWRINAIIVLVVGVLAGAVLTAAAYLLYRDATRTRHVDNVVSVALGEDVSSKATLGRFESLPKTAVLRAPLHVMQSYSIASGSKEASSIRNYLFYDPSTRTTRWLKPSMDSLIVQTWALPEEEGQESRLNWVASVYAIVTSDTSGDGTLSDSDRIKIASSDPDGSNFRVLVESADRLNEARFLSRDKILLLYSAGSKLYAVEFDPQQPQQAAESYEVKLPTVAR